jgi:hypothetical protein
MEPFRFALLSVPGKLAKDNAPAFGGAGYEKLQPASNKY